MLFSIQIQSSLLHLLCYYKITKKYLIIILITKYAFRILKISKQTIRQLIQQIGRSSKMRKKHQKVSSLSNLFPNKENADNIQNIINNNLPNIPQISSKRINSRNNLKQTKNSKDIKLMQNSLQYPCFKESSLFINKQSKQEKQTRKKTYLHLQSRKITSQIQNQKKKITENQKPKQTFRAPLSSRNPPTLNRVLVQQARINTARNQKNHSMVSIEKQSQFVQSSTSICLNDKTSDILKRHKITQKMRAKMVDWIIEVLAAYDYGQDTFFFTINTMDTYFQKSEKSILAQELHLIGVACIYLSVKFEEVCALRIKTVYQQIVHKKLSKQKIIERQADILNTLQFVIIKDGIYQYYQKILHELLDQVQITQRDQEILRKNGVYLLKMMTFDHQFYLTKDPVKLVQAVIFTAIRISNLQYYENQMHRILMKATPIDKLSCILELANEVFQRMINFEKQYPELKNLKKNNGQYIYIREAKLSLQSCII